MEVYLVRLFSSMSNAIPVFDSVNFCILFGGGCVGVAESDPSSNFGLGCCIYFRRNALEKGINLSLPLLAMD